MSGEFFGGVLIGVAIAWVAFASFSSDLLNNLKAEAIKRNAAEWIVDPATGKTTFTWKPTP